MKRKIKKRIKEKKRSEEKKYCPDSNSDPSVHRAKALPLDNVEHTHTQDQGIFIVKTFEPY